MKRLLQPLLRYYYLLSKSLKKTVQQEAYAYLPEVSESQIQKKVALPSKEKLLSYRQKGENSQKADSLLAAIETYLLHQYDFRFNLLTEITEFKRKGAKCFQQIGQRELNSLCIELRRQGINCWDRDVSRYVYSTYIPHYHPIEQYMNELPVWDGIDRLSDLALRVSDNEVWVMGFSRWMLGLVAQWLQVDPIYANSVAPVLVSAKQGMRKSTFCKMLLPNALQAYYTDSFNLNSIESAEKKLALFGLINLDEMDKLSVGKIALLKNLMQMAGINMRKAYKNNYNQLPRMASFIATSNQCEILTDPTGSRRFLCVEVNDKIDCLVINHDQLYAQLKTFVLSGEKYWFDMEEEEVIMQNNASFEKHYMVEDVFHTCFKPAKAEDKYELLSLAEIYQELKKQSPTALRETTPQLFGMMLIKFNIERIHTRTGNKYKVVRVCD